MKRRGGAQAGKLLKALPTDPTTIFATWQESAKEGSASCGDQKWIVIFSIKKPDRAQGGKSKRPN